MNKNYKFSICIPSYNGSAYIRDTIDSIINQSYKNFEIIISDDCSTDNTEDIVLKIKDDRIKFYKNKNNLGYGDNLKKFKKRISGEIMYMMAQDDLLIPEALHLTNRAYNQNPDIGAVIRPYYQFDYNPKIPVRCTFPPDLTKDIIVDIFTDRRTLEKVIESSGLLSALSYRVKYMDVDFHSHVFPAHAYPFFDIFKKHKIVFLHNYVVAVRIFSSQARFKSSIYEPSVTETWMTMFKTIFVEKKLFEIRKNCLDYVLRCYVGFVQIKNFSSYKNLFREIFIFIKYRWVNILNIKFWFYSILCILTPRYLLIKIVDGYKNTILSKLIRNKVILEY
jgi:glycosyltransferase involved in cell wall biosynthesis